MFYFFIPLAPPVYVARILIFYSKNILFFFCITSLDHNCVNVIDICLKLLFI